VRFQEIRAILDPDFKGDSFDEYHLKQYTKVIKALKGEEATLHDTFVAAVKDADCIVLDACVNSFGTYLAGRVSGLGNSQINYNDSYADVFESIVPGSKEAITKVVDKIVSTLQLSIDNKMVKELVDALTYSYLDLCVSFNEDIKLIRKINPTTKIIVLGPYNTMVGLSTTIGDVSVDLGALWGSLMDLVDLYLTTNTYANQYVYADVSGGIQMFWQAMAACETPDQVCDEFGEKIVADICGLPYCVTLSQTYGLNAEKIAGQYKSGLEEYYKKTTGQEGLGTVVYNNVLYTYMLAARYTEIDLMKTMADLSGYTAEATKLVKECIQQSSYQAIDKLFAAADPCVKSLLHIQLQFIIGMGLGSHPDETGCYQKFEAVKAAWHSILPASTQAADTGIQLGNHVGTALFGTFKTPQLQTIKTVWEKITGSFSDIFRNISVNIGK